MLTPPREEPSSRSSRAEPSAPIDRPLLEALPSLRECLPWTDLGNFPTPVDSLADVVSAVGCGGVQAFSKRDDLSSDIYGGNKVRTLELLFGEALAAGATGIASTGALGSNHAVATVLHAPRVGLDPEVVLFHQPPSHSAFANFDVIHRAAVPIQLSRHWSGLPFAVVRARRAARERRKHVVIMPPGGATPTGALGYVSAALELAQQVADGVLPRPRTVAIGVGSTCTSAGLLVGFHLAASLGIGFVDHRGMPAPPKLVSVRVTPWPVTSRFLIVRLAHATSRELARRSNDPGLIASKRALSSLLEIDGGALGSGYGKVTASGRAALEIWSQHGGHPLDTTYSGKAAAGFLELCRRGAPEPILFWSTKSTAPLPDGLNVPGEFGVPPNGGEEDARDYGRAWLNRWAARARRIA